MDFELNRLGSSTNKAEIELVIYYMLILYMQILVIIKL